MKERKKLLALADLVEKVPSKKFNMEVFATLDRAEEGPAECITAACALGWATTLFEELTLVKTELNYADVRLKGSGDLNFSAAQEFFGLSEDEADFAFNVSEEGCGCGTCERVREWYRESGMDVNDPEADSPQNVAKRLRWLAEN